MNTTTERFSARATTASRATPTSTLRTHAADVALLASILDFVWLWRNGYGNLYYAATVKSMTTSWHNFFYASFDPGGFVSIDKPPLGFWIQAAAAKLLGFPLGLLLPQALAGVLSVALLYHLMGRAWGISAGALAALGLALTPISVATNRDNAVDSLLVLDVLLATWAVTRAAEMGRLRTLLLGAVLIGLGFNVKGLQAYMVLPAFAALYLLVPPLPWRTRLAHLALATVVLVPVSLAWVVAVDLAPPAQRPNAPLSAPQPTTRPWISPWASMAWTVCFMVIALPLPSSMPNSASASAPAVQASCAYWIGNSGDR